MRYVTASLGAALMLVGCLVGCYVLTAFRPFQGAVTIPLGAASMTISNPVGFLGLPLGIIAAIHSFRSTLKREAQADAKLRRNQSDPPVSN
jgi:hypothetical protein